jgi:alkylated DNA repair dioxygenase AlkB
MKMQGAVNLFASEQALTAIPGLGFRAEWITSAEEQKLVEAVDAAAWSTELARRVQHYGYKYNYKTRRIDESMRLGSLPDWLQSVALRLVEEGLFVTPPDQVIVNEYLPGQGISKHIDCPPCFGDTVVSLSLLSGCLMEFTCAEPPSEVSMWLPPRSLVVLTGEARYEWKHSIAKRVQDQVINDIVPRQRRVSLTFRNVQQPAVDPVTDETSCM